MNLNLSFSIGESRAAKRPLQTEKAKLQENRLELVLDEAATRDGESWELEGTPSRIFVR